MSLAFSSNYTVKLRRKKYKFACPNLGHLIASLFSKCFLNPFDGVAFPVFFNKGQVFEEVIPIVHLIRVFKGKMRGNATVPNRKEIRIYEMQDLA